MGERLTWEEIQERYPDRWVGLEDVKFVDDDGVSVESAVVKYVDKPKTELIILSLQEDVVPQHTNPDGNFQVGVCEVFR